MPRSRRYVTLSCLLIFANFHFSAWGQGPTVRVAVSYEPLQVKALPLEPYLQGVLLAEMPQNWPAAALQAQAVAARTYAFYHLKNPKHKHNEYDLDGGIQDQAFRWQDVYPDSIQEAVQATAGQILSWHGTVIPAFFHSCSGGATERADRVWAWAQDWPFYQARPDPYGSVCPDEAWEFSLSKREFGLLLQASGLSGAHVNTVVPLSAEDNQRVQHLMIVTDTETLNLPGNQLRALLGFDRLRSTRFELSDFNGELVFMGSGFGHGVGLSQWGARSMAEAGKTYQDILQFYYPGADIQQAY